MKVFIPLFPFSYASLQRRDGYAKTVFTYG